MIKPSGIDKLSWVNPWCHKKRRFESRLKMTKKWIKCSIKKLLHPRKESKRISGKNESFPGCMWERNSALTGQTENREKRTSGCYQRCAGSFLSCSWTQQLHYNIYLKSVAVGFRAIFFRYLQIIPALFKGFTCLKYLLSLRIYLLYFKWLKVLTASKNHMK